jgi:DNA-binding winged helix-turn-helix (wHTH) protein/tetratricopeptide (TPR) repeat protein
MSSQKRQKNLESWRDAGNTTVWRFGGFTFDVPEGRLVRDGQPVAITPKAFEALVVLLTRRGQLVTRQQLLDELWPDTYVSDANLTGTMWMVRRALGRPDKWIETVPKRGYRFVGNASETRRLTDAVEHVTSRPGTANIRAYRLCLEGRNLCHAWPTMAFHPSRECFEGAIRLDQKYAEAYFGLALYHGIGAAMGLLHPVEAWRAFEVALATAQRLDRTLGENYNGLAATHLYLHRDWEKAERAFERALEIDPEDAETRNHYGFSLALFGRFDEAIAQIGRALELDPLSVRFQWNLASVFHQSGRYDDAIEHCGRTLNLDATYPPAYALMGDAYEQKGELTLALRNWRLARGNARHVDSATVEEFWRGQLDVLRNRSRKGAFVPAMDVARAHARLGDVDSTIEWLRKALQERSRLVLELPVDPLFDRFRGRPRFDAITAALPNGQVCRTPSGPLSLRQRPLRTTRRSAMPPLARTKFENRP